MSRLHRITSLFSKSLHALHYFNTTGSVNKWVSFLYIMNSVVLEGAHAALDRFIENEKAGAHPTFPHDPEKPTFLIHGTNNFTRQSNGIYVLYLLCHELNKRGFPAFIVGSNHTSPDLCAPLLSWKKAREIAKNAIAVYPEIVKGNPLRAMTVARWALNVPGKLGGDPIFAPNETVFSWDQRFLHDIHNPVTGILSFPYLETDLFYTDAMPAEARTKSCFYCGKSPYKEGFIHPEEMIEITRTKPAHDQLGNLFRSCRTLYSFDNTTALCEQARLCGCQVVLIPDGSLKREELCKNALGSVGFSWWGDPLPAYDPQAIAKNIQQKLDLLYKDSENQLNHFIDTMIHTHKINTAEHVSPTS